MSTAKIEAALRILEASVVLTPEVAQDIRDVVADARAELTAIRQASKTLSTESIGDLAYKVRDRHGDWLHPKVLAYSDATALVDAIAKETT